MNNQLLIILTLITGALIPIQAAANAACSKATGNPILAAFITLSTGLIAIILYMVISKTPLPEIATLKSVHPINFTAGLIVAIYLIIITFITPRLGVGSSIGLIITGQIIGAITIDHYGFFNTMIRTVDFKRVLGTLFMIIGIYLVMKK
jgi:bacterial/archaeal transporter family-2 protein